MSSLLTILALRDGPHPKDSQPVLQKMSRGGFDVTVEYPKGALRKYHNAEGKVVYQKRMAHHYGFFEGTKGRDGDEVDAILGPSHKFDQVHVVHMLDKGPDVDQREDEDKVMIGFNSPEHARTAFHQMYPKNFYGGMTSLPVDTFREKLATASLPYRAKTIHAARFDGSMGIAGCWVCGRRVERRLGREIGAACTCKHAKGAVEACPKCGAKEKIQGTHGTECSACGHRF